MMEGEGVVKANSPVRRGRRPPTTKVVSCSKGTVRRPEGWPPYNSTYFSFPKVRGGTPDFLFGVPSGVGTLRRKISPGRLPFTL